MARYQNREQLLALESLSTDSFLMINKSMIKIFGLNTAVVLGNLIDKYKYFLNKGDLQNDGSFFLTFENQEDHVGLSRHLIRKSKNELINKKVLKTRRKGVPAKEFYYINFKQIVEIIEESKLMTRDQGGLSLEIKEVNDKRSRRLMNIKETKYKDTKDKENKYKKTSRRKRKTSDNNVSEKVNIPETNRLSPVAIDRIKDSWNKIATSCDLPKIQKISPTRKAKLNTRANELDLFNSGDWRKLFSEIKHSEFLKGSNGWQINFDWIIKNEQNILKLMEGNYKDKSKKPKTTAIYDPDRYNHVKPHQVINDDD